MTHKVEPQFRRVPTDPWQVAFDENIARRHLTHGQKTMFGAARLSHEQPEAKKRQVSVGGRNNGRSNGSGKVSGTIKGDSRDKAGSAVGVSGKSIYKSVKILEVAPDIAKQVISGAVDESRAFS